MVIPRSFSSGCVVDAVKGYRFATPDFRTHPGQRRCQRRLAVVNVTNGAHVNVGFVRSNFLWTLAKHVSLRLKTPSNKHPLFV